MRVIIAGSRDIIDLICVIEAVSRSGFEITEVVSGTARGVDRLGEFWAAQHNIPIKRFPADWNTYGKSAGYKRNEQMADYAEAAIIIHDGKSNGTKHMLDIAKRKGLMVYYKIIEEKSDENVSIDF